MFDLDDALILRASEDLPQAAPDTDPSIARGNKYGEQVALSVFNGSDHLLAAEGSYYTLSNPAIGTFPQYALITAFNDTTGAMFAIKNNASVASRRRTYLRYLNLTLGGAAPATTVSMEFAVKVDNINRKPTAGATAALVPVNPNMDNDRASSSLVYAFTGAAALTVPASGEGSRLAARARVPTGLGIVGDQYRVRFGSTDANSFGGLTAARAVAPAQMVTDAAPVIIGPQQWAVIYMWWLTATTTAPSFEYELGLLER